MIKLHQWYCSLLGVGFIKGGGTIAAAITALVWWYTANWHLAPYIYLIITLLITGAGIWSASKMHNIWGKDSSKVVVDEVAGMAVSLLWIPLNPIYILLAFIFFRFFDITKPLFIRKTEALPKGWGVMVDDLFAGLYANILLQGLIIITNQLGWPHL